MSKINTENQKKLMNLHTTGKKSFALVHNKLKNKKGETLSLKEMFVVTRARKPNRTYKLSNEDITTVMGIEHPGCVRLLRRGGYKDFFEKIKWHLWTNFKFHK
ncbi:hypothetical protein P3S68_026295 [Capsicum galapagoense]